MDRTNPVPVQEICNELHDLYLIYVHDDVLAQFYLVFQMIIDNYQLSDNSPFVPEELVTQMRSGMNGLIKEIIKVYEESTVDELTTVMSILKDKTINILHKHGVISSKDLESTQTEQSTQATQVEQSIQRDADENMLSISTSIIDKIISSIITNFNSSKHIKCVHAP